MACRSRLEPVRTRPVWDNLGPNRVGDGGETRAGRVALRDRLRELELAVSELVAQQVHVPGGVAETVSDDSGRQPLDEGGARGLVAALQVVEGVGEVRCVAHALHYKL